LKNFINYLSDSVLATPEQRKKEIWDVEGRLKNGNQTFKFDIRPLKEVDNRAEKTGYFKSKSDKMVFETISQWIIFDTEELNEYVKSMDKRDFNLDELLDNLSWNLIIDKVE
jgi:CRISPR/Cas system-associated protein Csm6|tara:strand:- start:3796 stop:4131 length:336 start_codon:yes stop_codon:yes gene_type:complete